MGASGSRRIEEAFPSLTESASPVSTREAFSFPRAASRLARNVIPNLPKRSRRPAVRGTIAVPMFFRPASRLWLRMALPILLFAAAGSIALTLWLHAAARRESRRLFATLARTNAELLKSARLPANERVAVELSRSLGMRVFFRVGAWDLALGRGPAIGLRQSFETIPPIDGVLARHRRLLQDLGKERGIVRAGADFEAIAVPLQSDLTLILVRETEPTWAFLLRPATFVLLSLFWLASLGLAWILARGFVRPLRLLAERLPQIENDAGGALPGAERDDEIGQVARAYLITRHQLAGERQRRAQIERLAILGRMATGLAHEIYNPLAAIRMHAQLLQSTEPAELASAAQDSLPVLLGEAAKIEGLVQQWMFLARPQPPQTTPADLGEILAAVVRAISPQAAHAGVCILDEVPAGLFSRVDARRLSQAFGNIVANAIQAMPRGGTLTIRAAREASIRLTFSDTGPGFSATALAHHADLFFSTKEGGMGIGLSVTAEILKAHGGSLTVANSPNAGALVTLEIPALAADPLPIVNHQS